jgi:hypothetical protein
MQEEVGFHLEDPERRCEERRYCQGFNPVNSPFTLEELVHMIDVSVNSKYGADLEGITCTLTNSVRRSVESLKLEFKQESEKMPRQVRAIVQQDLDEARDKQEMGASSVANAGLGPNTMPTQGMPIGAGMPGARGGVVNLNF